MKINWQTKKLGDLVDEKIISLGRGNIISKKDIKNNPGEYPIYSSAKENDGLFGRYGLYMFDEPLITWSVDGGGRLFYRTKHKFSVTNVGGFIRINRKDILDYKYLFHILSFKHSQIKFDWVKKAHPSVIRELYTDLPLPPLSEQVKIAKILDDVFEKLEKAKENTEKNLQNSNDLFESYLQSVFSNPKKDWEEKRFDEICVLQRGFDLPTRLRNEGKFPLVSSNGITDRINLWKVKAPGVVTGRSGTIGNVHFIEEDFWPLNTALYIKDFHGNNERFIFYFLRQFNLNKFSSGAGVPTLNRNNVHGEMVWFPKSIKEQKSIVKTLDQLSKETQKLESVYKQKLESIEELKKSILNKVFSKGL